MPPRTAPKNASAAATVGGRDHISNLPDDALHHMLSFLPALDVVRTCVLAKRWRHLWKSTTVLRFVCGGFKEPKSIKKIQDFVDQLLRLRIGERTPLDTCEFRVGEDDEFDMIRFILWIRIALQCKVRVLQVISNGSYPGIQPLDDHPFFISQYLTRLELKQVYETKPNRFLDLSCCPNLEDLEIVDCCLEGALLLSSQSLKCLFIEDSSFGDGDDGCRMPICAPNLVSLWLDVYCGRTPLLQRMPSLLTAFVKIRDSDDHVTLAFDDDSNQSILLQALSEVSNLSLLSLDDEMFVFRRDLKFCSGFNNLKSLLLNEYWCEPADFSALACLLKLCPVLEKLTLELYSTGPKYKMEIKLNCNPLEISPEISPHLKIVEVKCQEYDERINNVLTFLTKQIYFS